MMPFRKSAPRAAAVACAWAAAAVAEDGIRVRGDVEGRVFPRVGRIGEAGAPYDAIIVTAAPEHIPEPLIDQLADGGRMVIPMGPAGGYQRLWLLERHGQEVSRTQVMGVAFVPFTRRSPAE